MTIEYNKFYNFKLDLNEHDITYENKHKLIEKVLDKLEEKEVTKIHMALDNLYRHIFIYETKNDKYYVIFEKTNGILIKLRNVDQYNLRENFQKFEFTIDKNNIIEIN